MSENETDKVSELKVSLRQEISGRAETELEGWRWWKSRVVNLREDLIEKLERQELEVDGSGARALPPASDEGEVIESSVSESYNTNALADQDIAAIESELRDALRSMRTWKDNAIRELRPCIGKVFERHSDAINRKIAEEIEPDVIAWREAIDGLLHDLGLAGELVFEREIQIRNQTMEAHIAPITPPVVERQKTVAPVYAESEIVRIAQEASEQIFRRFLQEASVFKHPALVAYYGEDVMKEIGVQHEVDAAVKAQTNRREP